MKTFRALLGLGLAIACLASAAPAEARPASEGPAGTYRPQVLRIGFIPSENMERVMTNAQPVVATLRKALGIKVVPFVATDYTGVIEAMRGHRLDVAFFAPASYIWAEKEAGAVAILKSVRHGKSVFFSAIITRADSGIRSLKDLKGRTFAFGDPLSTAGTIFPKALLISAGLNPERDFKRVLPAGGHDATVLAVFNHKVDAGATFADDTSGQHGAWYLFLKKPGEAQQIRAIAYSPPVPSDNIAVRGDLDPALVAQIKQAFMAMGSTPAGHAQLHQLYDIDGFVPASPAEYSKVREAFNKVGIRLR